MSYEKYKKRGDILKEFENLLILNKALLSSREKGEMNKFLRAIQAQIEVIEEMYHPISDTSN